FPFHGSAGKGSLLGCKSSSGQFTASNSSRFLLYGIIIRRARTSQEGCPQANGRKLRSGSFMNLNGVSRRKFLKAGGASLGAALMRSRAASFQVGANDRIQLGFIGVGGMGMNRLRGFLQHKDVDVIAICDVDSRHRAEAIAEVQKQRGNKPVEFGDFRLLLEENDIDAVVIATPDHWHAIPTVQACDAGKDVFVEKPLSYSVVD